MNEWTSQLNLVFIIVLDKMTENGIRNPKSIGCMLLKNTYSENDWRTKQKNKEINIHVIFLYLLLDLIKDRKSVREPIINPNRNIKIEYHQLVQLINWLSWKFCKLWFWAPRWLVKRWCLTTDSFSRFSTSSRHRTSTSVIRLITLRERGSAWVTWSRKR